jgi:hypothetical protein
MRPIIYVAMLAWVLASGEAQARDTPEWDRVKACFDNNLVVLIRSNEPIEAVFRAVRAICQDPIDDALKETFASIAASESDPKTPVEFAAMRDHFNKRVDTALFAYAVKFKAVGGPTTLQY